MVNSIKVIEEIRKSELCTGCGTCAGVCPTGAIKIAAAGGIYLPVTDDQKCVNCGQCVASCPGHSVDFNDLNEKLFGQQPNDFSFGNFLKCYVGHSNNLEVRYQAASGGLASQLLISALEMGLIDGALVVRMRSDRPLETEAFIAKTKEEILFASKSKYCPVASNEVLSDILSKNQRIAIVGLPCHIHGIRKAEVVNRKLKEKIVLHIGLMCSHCVNFAGTELVLEKLGINRDNVKDISYRGYGWPGGLRIILKDGSRRFIPLFGTWNSYWAIFSSYLFTPPRCLMCPDHTAELADISLGDAWYPELGKDKVGRSVIVTRTKIAEDIVTSVSALKAISLVEISAEKVKQSQKLLIKFKKDFFWTRLSLLKMLGKQTPDFKMHALGSSDGLWSPTVFLKAFYPFFNSHISKSKKIKSVLKYIPLPLFRLYFGIYKFLSYI